MDNATKALMSDYGTLNLGVYYLPKAKTGRSYVKKTYDERKTLLPGEIPKTIRDVLYRMRYKNGYLKNLDNKKHLIATKNTRRNLKMEARVKAYGIEILVL